MKKNKSARKRAKQAEARRRRNAAVKSMMKTYVKKALIVAQENREPSEVGEYLRKAISVINKAASKGVIHKRTASRKISRLTKKVNKLIQKSA